MICPVCTTTNDPDAAFCIECGKALSMDTVPSPARSRKSYVFILVLVPVLALLAGLGYYKFVLPDGVVAVVNGEEIKLPELDAAVSRMERAGSSTNSGFRYQMLNMLITDRLALQEARKAGITVSREEIASALGKARESSGLDEAAFDREVGSQYGGMGAFQAVLEERILMNKFIEAKVIPPGAEPQAARIAVDRWLLNLRGKASVRISLTEHGPGPGCGCCNKSNENSRHQGMSGQGCVHGDRARPD